MPARPGCYPEGSFVVQLHFDFMKRVFFSIGILFWIYVSGAQNLQLHLFYVGTFTSEGAEGIYLCSFNSQDGELKLLNVFKGIDNPGYLQKSPDGKFLYVAGRSPAMVDSSGGQVIAFQIENSGNLVFLNKQSSHGADPCYVDVSPDGKKVVVANYGGGSVAMFNVNQDGSLQPASCVIRHTGSGPDPVRQKKPYAHSIRFIPQNNLIYATDLGTDRLFIYSEDPVSGRMIPYHQPYAKLPPGSGPRHFDFSQDGRFCYVVNELISSVTVFENSGGALTEIQTIPALPEGFSGTSYCADIHISQDGKWVYASNRGHNSVVVFKRFNDGKLEIVKHVGVEGNWPRNFTLDPTGNYMLVANQRSNNITVFRMENGIPVFTGKSLPLPAPVCIEF